MPKSKTKKCKTCNGTGKVMRERENRFDYQDVDCPKCEGRGVVPK